MRGFHKGVWYAEVYESTRHVGIETISVHEFETEKERDKFVNEYNQVLFTRQSNTSCLQNGYRAKHLRNPRVYFKR